MKGFALPFTIILSLILMTGVSFWYQRSLMKSVLSKRLLEQRGYFIECESLIPVIRKRLESFDPATLTGGEDRFMIIEADQEKRWEIDRSAITQGKIKLTFHGAREINAEIQLLIAFEPT